MSIKLEKPADDPRKQRLTDQLIDYWESLREDRPFPAVYDLMPKDIRSIWDSCFLVELSEGKGPQQYRHQYSFVGKDIREMFGGYLAAEDAMVMVDDLCIKYLQVARNHTPVIEEDEFINVQQRKIMYRQIFLPLGPSPEKVDHVVGGIRFRFADDR